MLATDRANAHPVTNSPYNPPLTSTLFCSVPKTSAVDYTKQRESKHATKVLDSTPCPSRSMMHGGKTGEMPRKEAEPLLLLEGARARLRSSVV